MSSIGGGWKLKPKGFEIIDDISEEDAREFFGLEYPELSYSYDFESYYPQTSFSWSSESVTLSSGETSTRFTVHSYVVLTAVMENLERIHVDGRNAPYEGSFRGHYLEEGSFDAVTYVIEEIDYDTGEVLSKREIDTHPDIVHDVDAWEKEHLAEKTLVNDKSRMEELLEASPRFYDLCTPSLKEDEQLALKAVKGSGYNYEHLIDRFKERRDFRLLAAETASLRILPEEVMGDHDFLLEACKKNRDRLYDIDDKGMRKRIEEELGQDPDEDDLPW